MATIEENLANWSAYDWPDEGEVWSDAWGSSEYLWWGSIFPRILAFVPVDTILEIAPGYGRCTQYLKQFCRVLIGVDLTPRCVEACRERFRGDSNVTFAVNDGKSLPMVPDGSVDFAFSFDSLVHVEADVVRSYLRELSSKLRPGALGFIHHSNIGAFVDRSTGRLPFENRGWRGESMTAEIFREACAEVGLSCLTQERINWGGEHLIDCFSVFTRPIIPIVPLDRTTQVVDNPDFLRSVQQLFLVSRLYGTGRWTAKRRADLVLSILRGERSVEDAAREHGLTPQEIEDWRKRFLLGAERALRR
jgi:SAM-dependent methyltransferase